MGAQNEIQLNENSPVDLSKRLGDYLSDVWRLVLDEDAQGLQRNSQWKALSQRVQATSLIQITVIHGMLRAPGNVKSKHLLDSQSNKEIRHRLFWSNEGRIP